jgi:rhodanese-related sulfurtransferase
VWPFSRRATSSSFTDIEPAEAFRRAGKGDLLVDVRQPSELTSGRFPKAVNVPLGELETYAAGLDKSSAVMLVCRSGSRSRKAAKRLAGLGFSDVSNVRGGIVAWGRAGLPLKGARKR